MLTKEVVQKMLYNLIPELEAAKDKLAFKLSKDQLKLINDHLSQDAIDTIHHFKLANIAPAKGAKEIFYHFFGMNENWNLGRNIAGGLMVHCPEWPTYFIPAYTQSKATGDASDLKKGEGARGILTGGLEGIAVGALVSGRMLKPKEMVPYIILGAALQLFSSKIFPWAGEKLGRIEYNKMHPKPGGDKMGDPNNPVKFDLKLPNPVQKTPAFKGKPLSNSAYSSRMKV